MLPMMISDEAVSNPLMPEIRPMKVPRMPKPVSTPGMTLFMPVLPISSRYSRLEYSVISTKGASPSVLRFLYPPHNPPSSKAAEEVRE